MNAKRSLLPLLAAALLSLPTLAEEPAASGVTVASLALDPGFGTDGVVRAAGAGSTHLDMFSFARVDSHGRIVVAGATFTDADSPSGYRLAPGVARFLADGTIDTKFGSGGVALAPIEAKSMEGLVLDADDSAVICGLFVSPPRSSFYPNVGAVRFTPQGEFDEAFRGNGQVQYGARTFAHIAAAPDGSAYYIAQSTEHLEADGAVYTDGIVRIRADGTRDSGYGDHGLARTESGVVAIAVDGEGRVLAAVGRGIVRFLPDGTRDSTFADVVVADESAVDAYAEDLSIDETGRILVYRADGIVPRGIYRFLADGALDTSFADQGFARFRQAFPGDAKPFRATFGAGGRAALGATLSYLDPATGDLVGRGLWVQAFDPSRPAAVLGHVPPRDTPPDPSLGGVIVTPDGSALIVTGSSRENNVQTPFLMRVALDSETPQSVPNLAASWTGPIKTTRNRSHRKLRGRLRITNDGLVPVANAIAELWLSRDEVVDGEDVRLLDVISGPIGPGQSFTSKVSHAVARDFRTRGFHVIARIDVGQLLPQTSYADDVAVSESLR